MSSHTINSGLCTSPQDRLVFPPTFEVLRPFFDLNTQWGTTGQEVLAYRTLKDHFPELSPQDVFLTVIAARRLFRAGSDI